MAEPGVPHSPQDGAQEPEDADLFRDEPAPEPATLAPRRPTWAAPVRPAPEPEPEPDHHAHDELIGFTSAASLTGVERRAPEPEPVPEPEPEIEPAPEAEMLAEPEPIISPIPEPDPVVLAPTFAAPRAYDPILDVTPEPEDAPKPSAPASSGPSSSGWSVDTPLAAERVAADSLGPLSAAPAFSRPASSTPTFGRADQKGNRNGSGDAPEGATGLYTIYALILFAVPTFGVAAMIGLLMVWMRPKPEQHLARSHFEFQTRTLWIAAIAAVVGAVLVAVNLGVLVLFLMAVWVIVRGAWGVMALAAGKPVANPRTWMI